MLIKTMKLRLDELAVYMAFDLGGFLFGSLLLAVITYFEGGGPDYGTFPIGTVMACVIFCFLSIMLSMVGMGGYFNWHVGFGRTRKSFFLCDMATEFCWNFISLVVIWGLSFIEGGILRIFYSPYSEDESSKILWGMRSFWIIPVFALLLTVIRELAGSLFIRFGNKAAWSMWAIWMFVCLVSGKFTGNKDGRMAETVRAIGAWIWGMSVTGWVFMGIAFVILSLAVSWMLMRKQAVRDR